MKTSLTIFPCVLGSTFPIIRVCLGLSFVTKRIGHLGALYLLLLLVARYNLSYHKTICYHLFQYLQRIPCWKPLIISFCSSLGSKLLLIERTTIDPQYLWVIIRPEVCGRELIAHLRFVRMCSPFLNSNGIYYSPFTVC